MLRQSLIFLLAHRAFEMVSHPQSFICWRIQEALAASYTLASSTLSSIVIRYGYLS